MSTSTIERERGPEKPNRKKSIYAVVLLVLMIGLVLGLSSVAMAAVAVDATSSAKAITVNTISVSHTTGAGANRLMLVGVSWNCGTTTAEGETISAATFTPSGGSATPLTLVATRQSATDSFRYTALYYLLNPPTGAGTVNITFVPDSGDPNDGVDGGIVAGVTTFTGVHQTTPLGAYVAGSGGSPSGSGSSPGAINVAATAGDLVFDGVFKGGQTSEWAPAASQTQLWNDINDYARGGASTKPCASTGDVAMSWSGTDTGYWCAIGVPIKPAPATFTLTYTAGANGTISGTTPQTVASGGSGTEVTAVPNANYHFTSWSDGVLTAARTDSNVLANLSVTANFAIDTRTLTYTAGANGTISGTSPQTVNYGGSGTAVTAVPNANYHFVSWSDAVLTATRTDINVTANLSVTANFASDNFTLTYTAGANGTISGVSPQTVAPAGSGTPVTAVPNANYHFVSWSDAVLTATRTDTNVAADINVTAIFAINTYTLTYTAGANGTITGTSPQTVDYGASGAAVTAVPNSGYHFVNWSDSFLNATRTDTNVTANLTVTANFARNPIVYTSLRGTHRYQTAQLISQAMFPTALPAGAGVVVAPGETFQEALCGAPLASAYGGPVLLTPVSGLENGTRLELQRLAPTYVFVIGLSSAISTAVQTALPTATVVPINGANVYAMSANVAHELETKVGDMSGATAIITIGTNFPDAIGVSPLACANQWPVILTDSATGVLHVSAQAALTDLGITKALKVGTYATLPGGVTGLANLSGTNRYVTNVNVANWAKTNAGLVFVHTGIATGDKFPDALAAGPYLAKDFGILLLSPLAGPLPANIGAVITANAAAVQHVTFIAMIEPVISQVKVLLP